MTHLTRWDEAHGVEQWLQGLAGRYGLPVWSHSREASLPFPHALSTKTESLLLSMMKQPQISHLFQRPDEQPPPSLLRPQSQIHRLPRPALPHTQNQLPVCVRACARSAAQTQQVTLSLSQTVVLREVCRNSAPPKSWQLPQKQWGNVWRECETLLASQDENRDQDCSQRAKGALVVHVSTGPTGLTSDS